MRRSGGADCGDPGRKLGRGGIAGGGVRSLAVVVADPFANRAAGMAEAEEQRLVEQLGIMEQAHHGKGWWAGPIVVSM